ncbi:MAG: hypothetical protein RQ750_01880 [Roseovarius sp.]|nr:hypothetical protein [Roseovarius sp.]
MMGSALDASAGLRLWLWLRLGLTPEGLLLMAPDVTRRAGAGAFV